jgi:hypothetical protein
MLCDPNLFAVLLFYFAPVVGVAMVATVMIVVKNAHRRERTDVLCLDLDRRSR